MTIQFILYNFFITFISSYINIPFLCDSLHVFLFNAALAIICFFVYHFVIVLHSMLCLHFFCVCQCVFVIMFPSKNKTVRYGMNAIGQSGYTRMSPFGFYIISNHANTFLKYAKVITSHFYIK